MAVRPYTYPYSLLYDEQDPFKNQMSYTQQTMADLLNPAQAQANRTNNLTQLGMLINQNAFDPNTNSMGVPVDYNTDSMGQQFDWQRDRDIRIDQMNRNVGMGDQTYVDPSQVNAKYYENIFKQYGTEDKEYAKTLPATFFGKSIGVDINGNPLTKGQLENMSLGDAYLTSKKNINNIPVYGPMANFVEEIANPIPNVEAFLNYIEDADVVADIDKYVRENPGMATVEAVSAYLIARGGKFKKAYDKLFSRYRGPKLVKNNKKTGKFESTKGKFNTAKFTNDAATTALAVNSAVNLYNKNEPEIANTINSLMSDNDKTVTTTETATKDDKAKGVVTNEANEKAPQTVEVNNKLANSMKAKNPGLFGALLNQIPSGAGGWDTGLFRLGELMVAMDRGNPAVAINRWNDTSKNVSKALSDAIKNGQTLTQQQKNLAMKGLPSDKTLQTLFTKNATNWLGLEKSGPGTNEEALAAKLASQYKEVYTSLVMQSKPYGQNAVLDEMERLGYIKRNRKIA